MAYYKKEWDEYGWGSEAGEKDSERKLYSKKPGNARGGEKARTAVTT